ncbi:MAG: MFS transporter [Anaerolineales bacterium]
MNQRIQRLIAYYAAYFVLGATIASLGPSLIYLGANTATQTDLWGLLFLTRSAGYLSGSLIGGRLFQRINGSLLLSVALLIAALVLGLLPTISVFSLLMAAMLIIGACEGELDVGCNLQLVWSYRQHSAPYLNGMFLLAALGGVFSPLLFSLFGGMWAYRALALIKLPLVAVFYFLPAPDPQHEEADQAKGKLKPLWFGLLCLIVLIYVGGEVSFSGWLSSYAYSLSLATEQTGGMLTSFYWMGILLGRALAIPLTRRIALRRMVLFCLAGILLSFAVILFDPLSTALLWCGAFGVGLFLAPLFPTTFAFLEKQASISGSLAGILWASGSFGAMLYPWLIGQQMAQRGSLSLMSILAISFGVALVLFWWISGRLQRGLTTNSS